MKQRSFTLFLTFVLIAVFYSNQTLYAQEESISQDSSDIPASVKEPGLNIGNSEISLGLNMGFNLYDGFYLGLGIKNIRNQKQPFLFYAKPAYAFKSKNIVGTAGIKWNQLINSNARFYLQSHLKSFAFLNKSEYDLDYWRWASAAGVAIDDLNETGYKMVFQFDYERLGRDFPFSVWRDLRK